MFTPALIESMAREIRADLHRSVRHRPRRRKAPPPRQRVGWFLVEVGLRLVAQP